MFFAGFKADLLAPLTDCKMMQYFNLLYMHSCVVRCLIFPFNALPLYQARIPSLGLPLNDEGET